MDDDKLIIGVELDDNGIKTIEKELGNIKTKAEKENVILNIKTNKLELDNEIKKIKKDFNSEKIKIDTELNVDKNNILSEIDNIKYNMENALSTSDYNLMSKDLENAKSELKELENEIKKNKSLKIDTSESGKKIEELEKSKQDLDKSLLKARAIKIDTDEAKNKLKELNKETSKTRKITNEDDMFSGFRKSTSGALKLTGALFGIRAMYGFVRKSATEFFNSGTEQANQMAGMFQTIASTVSSILAPVFTWLINLVATLLGYVNALLKAFFGIELSTGKSSKNVGGMAKGSKNTAKELKKANKELAGFDKINKLGNDNKSKDTGSGGGASALPNMKLPTPDISGIKKVVDNLLKMFDPFIKTIQSINFDPIVKSAQKLSSALLGALSPIGDLFVFLVNYALAPFIQAMSEIVVPMALDTLANLLITITPLLEIIKNVAIELFEIAIKPLGEFLLDVFIGAMTTINDILSMIQESFSNWNEKLKENDEMLKNVAIGVGVLVAGLLAFTSPVSLVIAGIVGLIAIIQKLWEKSEGFRNLIKSIIDLFVDLFFTLMETVGEVVSTIVERLQEFYEKNRDVFDGIKVAIDFILKVISKAIDLVKVYWGGLIGAMGSILGGLFNTVMDVIDNIIGVFRGLITFIQGVFSGDWGKAWEGVKQILYNIISGIANIFKSPINIIIDGLNGFIRGVNKIKIPNWVPAVGGKGINIQPIQRLARGTIVSKPTQLGGVEFGEKGAEIFAPLESFTGWMDKVAERMSERLKGSNETVVVQFIVDEDTLMEKIFSMQELKKLQFNGG